MDISKLATTMNNDRTIQNNNKTNTSKINLGVYYDVQMIIVTMIPTLPIPVILPIQLFNNKITNHYSAHIIYCCRYKARLKTFSFVHNHGQWKLIYPP